MKNFFKYIGLSTLLIFSFYYTEKMSNIVTTSNKLFIKINENSEKYNIKPVSATIKGDYIIPGLNGYAVNVLRSYNNMRHLDDFNSYYLEYDITKPSVSIDNNKEKIIKYGNDKKKEIAIIIRNNNEILEYVKKNNVVITRIVDINTFDKFAIYEQINGDVDNYNKVEKLLTKYNYNKNICYIDTNIKDTCINNMKYLVEASVILNNYNLSDIKDIVQTGYIIYINDNVNLSEFKILIKQLLYKDLKIVTLSELISEK